MSSKFRYAFLPPCDEWIFPRRARQKNIRKNIIPIADFRLRQTPDSHLAAPCKSAFAQSVNRTKVFHVKRFCPIGRQNLTKLMFKISGANENLALVALEPDPRVAAHPLAPLKGTNRDEPYRNDALRELAADGAFVIVENGLLFLEPGA